MFSNDPIYFLIFCSSEAANPSQPLPSAPVSRVPRPATPPPPAEVLPPPGPVPIALPPSNANEPPPPSAQNQQATPAAAVGADPVDLVVSAARAGRDEVLLHASISPGPGGIFLKLQRLWFNVCEQEQLEHLLMLFAWLIFLVPWAQRLALRLDLALVKATVYLC